MRKKIVIVLLMTMLATPAFGLGPVKEIGGNLWTNIANTAKAQWQFILESVKKPAIEALVEKSLEKIANDSINWARGGFQGDPGYISNLEVYLKDTKYEKFDEIKKIAETTYKESVASGKCVANGQADDCNKEFPFMRNFNECMDGLVAGQDDELIELCEETLENEEAAHFMCTENLKACINDPAQQARQNFETLSSGEAKKKKNLLKTVIDFGASELNDNDIKNILSGESESIGRILGSEAAVKEFNNNFKGDRNNLLAYLALTDLNNSDIGREALLKSSIGKAVAKKQDEVLQDLGVENKFLDKTRCLEYEKLADGQRGECIQTEVITDRNQVSEKVTISLSKDEKFISGADGLIAGLLKGAFNRLTSDLISKGVTGLGNAIRGNRGSTQNNSFSQTTTRSDFDLFNTGTESGSGSDTIIDQREPNQGAVTTSLNGSNIGGPEDARGFGQGGPQIIINFEDDLENNIEFVNQEITYREQIQEIRSSSQRDIITLDQCLPGPDYGWENRLRDNTSSLETNAYIGETRKAFSDPKIAIPGSQRIKSIIESSITSQKQDAFNDEQRIEILTEAQVFLNYVKDQVKANLNSQTNDYVLFRSDWEQKNQQEKISSLEQITNEGYFILKPGETLEQIISSEELRARDAVISTSWEKWRELTSVDTKNLLRTDYNNRQYDLSSSAQVTESRSILNSTKVSTKEVSNLLNDCLAFRAYALGMSENEIQKEITNKDKVSTSFISQLIFQPTTRKTTLDGNTRTLDVSNARSNSSIKSFINTQFDKQQASQPSIFKTTAVTGTVDTSILGFDSEEDLDEYFENNYPESETDTSIVRNIKTIEEIIQYDRFFSRINKRGAYRGFLYCRHGDKEQETSSSCLDPWYISSELDYQVNLYGI